MKYSEAIKLLRKTLILSQVEFAELLGVSYMSVNRWETGKSKPNYNTMKLINEFCEKHSIDFDITDSIMEDNK